MLRIEANSLITRARRAASHAVVAGTVFAGLLTAGPAAAQVKVVTSDFPPLTIADPASPKKGLLYDVVIELLKMQGLEPKIEFKNWADAQKEAATTPDMLLFPMTRTPKRESQYKWCVKIFDLDRLFTTLPGSTPVNSFEEAAKLKAVGVLVNSASLSFLKDKGLTNISEQPSNPEMMKALRDGKIDAIYQPPPYSKADWKAIGGQGSLVFGKTLEEAGAYIVASPTSTINCKDWADTFDVVDKEGRFEALKAAYGLD